MACETCETSEGEPIELAYDARAMRGRKVLLVTLCDEEEFVTVGDGAYKEFLRGPWLKDFGPKIQDIVVHSNGRNFGTTFKYRIMGEYSYDGETWTGFGTPILGQQVSAGQRISDAWTDRSVFGPWIRFKVSINDTSVKEPGTLSVVVAIKLFT